MTAIVVAERAAAYTALAALLDRPGEDLIARVQRAQAVLGEPAADTLAPFADAVSRLAPERMQEVHLSTFDLAPCCVPYLSVYLFGEESFKRAELMTAFSAAYERAGFDATSELPDHIATVLEFAPNLPEDEFRELLEHCLEGPVTKMHKGLNGAGNPYRFVLEAILLTVKRDLGEENFDG